MGGRRRGRRTLVISFGATLLVLFSSLLFLSSFDTSAPVRPLPEDALIEMEDWMKFVPPETERVLFYNLSTVASIPGNLSIIPTGKLLNIVSAEMTIWPEDSGMVAYLVLPNSGRESTIAQILRPTEEDASSLSGEMNDASTSNEEHGGVFIYSVINRLESNPPKLAKGYLSFPAGFVIFTEGGDEALLWTRRMIDVSRGKSEPLHSVAEIRKASLLATGGIRPIGFSITTFESSVQGAKSLLKAITNDGQYTLQVVAVFPGSADPSGRRLAMQRAFPGMGSYEVYEHMVLASIGLGVDQLEAELRSL